MYTINNICLTSAAALCVAGIAYVVIKQRNQREPKCERNEKELNEECVNVELNEHRPSSSISLSESTSGHRSPEVCANHPDPPQSPSSSHQQSCVERRSSEPEVDLELNERLPPITLAGLDPELDIKIITTAEESNNVVHELRRRSAQYHALGFDCEWVNKDGRKPVAMLQLSTHDGYCALFRLCLIKSIPLCLKEILEDKTILKLGVGCYNDASYLEDDYSVHTKGTLDLNFVTRLCRYETGGLATLAKLLLGTVLNKNLAIRCGNWEVEELSVEQINYAARDAHVAIKMFVKLINMYYKNPETATHWDNVLGLCENYIDRSYFRIRNKDFKHNVSPNMEQNCTVKIFSKRCFPLIKKYSRPYNNKWGVRAPDGEKLCECFYKKAYWYLIEELADIVQVRPPEIRLRFEPVGRRLGGAGFYLELSRERDRCVVCGAKRVYVKRHVVPEDYLKFFPEDKRSEAGEPVLLCAACWRRYNWRELTLRERLAARARAPFRPALVQSDGCRQVRDAAQMLLNACAQPMSRAYRAELNDILLQQYIPEGEISKELLLRAARVEIDFVYDEEHSAAVVQYSAERGELRALCGEWRRHFRAMLPPAMVRRELALTEERLFENETVSFK